MAGAQTLFVACVLSVLGGAGNGIQWVSVMTALQEATPADYQARVVGLLESLGRGDARHRLPARRRSSPRSARRAPRTRSRAIGTLVLVLVGLAALRRLRLGHPSRRSSDLHPPVGPDVHRPEPREVSLDTGDR